MLNPLYREPLPPEGRPIGRQELFYKQSWKMQCFIFLKYRERRGKKLIMKFLFIESRKTYYKYEKNAKEIVQKAYKGISS